MRHAKLCFVLLVLGLGWHGLPERGFAWDYTQSTNFGVLNPGDHVNFKVAPPKNAEGKDAIVTSGRVDNPGGFIWVGSLANWSGTVPPDFAAQHIGLFSGEYGYPGTNVSRALTWKMDTLAEVVKLETITDATIPSDRTRRKLGVGEKVTLTLKGADNSVVWSRIGLGSIYPMSGNSAKFTAYEKGIGALVIATYKGKQFSVSFPVVEPSIISAIKLLPEYYYPPGEQGAGMQMELTIHPTDVSFNEVKTREVAGSATEIWGYFTKYSSEQLYHYPKPWVEINAENWITDEAYCSDCTPPWYPGGYKWVIPIEWQAPEGTYIGRLPDNAVQTFSISDTNGTTTVSKQFGNSVSVTRTP